MDPVSAEIVAIGCYLIGSFSFSRRAVRLLAPGKDIGNIQMEITGTGKTMNHKLSEGRPRGDFRGKNNLPLKLINLISQIYSVLVKPGEISRPGFDFERGKNE